MIATSCPCRIWVALKTHCSTPLRSAKRCLGPLSYCDHSVNLYSYGNITGSTRIKFRHYPTSSIFHLTTLYPDCTRTTEDHPLRYSRLGLRGPISMSPSFMETSLSYQRIPHNPQNELYMYNWVVRSVIGIKGFGMPSEGFHRGRHPRPPIPDILCQTSLMRQILIAINFLID